MKKEFKIVGCIGCGSCINIDPENFVANDNCLAEIKKDADENAVASMISKCPVFAIIEN